MAAIRTETAGPGPIALPAARMLMPASTGLDPRIRPEAMPRPGGAPEDGG
jgi:hypothetical protein